ncbi:MAG: hypothetical protein C4321_01580 [Chloroflexota bacterium]
MIPWLISSHKNQITDATTKEIERQRLLSKALRDKILDLLSDDRGERDKNTSRQTQQNLDHRKQTYGT